MSRVKPKTYQNPIFHYKRSTDQDAPTPVKHPVVIIGSGPTGLTAALDLAQRGIRTVLITKENSVAKGSRAICFSKKTLEVIHRLGLVDKMLDKGVIWSLGKVFYAEELVYTFNLLPEEGHKIPAFINLQQYYFEAYLVKAVQEHPLIDLRWEEELINLEQDEEMVRIRIQTPEGSYQTTAEYLLACDGVHSPCRKILGVPYEGEAFEENFLIADISMEKEFPTERWFWFDPPFNRGYSALLHKQPDGIWRIDLQLGRKIDKAKELDPARIRARLRQMLGPEVNFELEWTSVYQFRCMRMEKFVHNRIIFAGDAAHLVSPFGARGANGGVQDVDNLCWKLAYVLKGEVPHSFLHTYDEERSPATDENIYHSSNATDFISPKSEISLQFRNAALELARQDAFARSLINSGRLSHPFRYVHSSLTSPDIVEQWNTNFQTGSAVKDGLMANGFLVDELSQDFNLMVMGDCDFADEKLKVISITEQDADVISKYDLEEGSWYLIRPDHYIAARGRIVDPELIKQAMNRSLGIKVGKAHQHNPDLFRKYQNDEKYKWLIEAHKDLSPAESAVLNHKLILLLMENVDLSDLVSIRKLIS